MTPRRIIPAILAAAIAVAGWIGPMIGPADAATTPHYLIIGASVTRIAGDELRIAYGSSLDLQAVDGRGFTIGDNVAGLTIMDVFRAKLAYQRPGDWVVIEMSHGGIDVATNRRYLTEVVRLLPDSVCLAVVAPHTYYGDTSSISPEAGWPMRGWNADMKAMQIDVIARQPCHRLVDWDFYVTRSATGPLGEPVLYDGRHPTVPYGAHLYASAIWWACR